MDNYYVLLDEVETVIEKLENKIIAGTDDQIKGQIYHLKQELMVIRKALAPLREAVAKFAKSDHDLIEPGTTVFVRDLYDHNVQLLDTTESYRDMLNSLQDLYLSEISHRMNQVMQVLTLITTIFVPLSFLAGLYGMNFANMPELQWKYGYFILLGIMLVIGVSLLLLFKRRKWF